MGIREANNWLLKNFPWPKSYDEQKNKKTLQPLIDNKVPEVVKGRWLPENNTPADNKRPKRNHQKRLQVAIY